MPICCADRVPTVSPRCFDGPREQPNHERVERRCAAAGSLTIGQAVHMIYGSHVVVFSSDPDADRAFLADVLELDHVDAGGGWLIFGIPPAELAVHPAEAPGSELYFMCDDLAAEIRRLAEKGVQCSPVEEARWGSVIKVRLPGGSDVGLYEPRHAAMVNPS
jgi:hypothetical protein